MFGIPMGAAAKLAIVDIAAQLRERGIAVDMAYGNRGMKGAMKAADRSGARYALVLGDQELSAESIVMKDLSNGEQETVALADVVDVLGVHLGR